MRIFVLPLTTRQALIYCQKAAQQTSAPPSIPDRVTNFAAKTWAKWETAEKGWKKTVVQYGNAGLKRIPYEEWGLKSFPPGTPKQQAETLTSGKKFDVFFPGNVMHQSDVPKVMLRLARERKQLHWNRFIGSMLVMPLTLPFALVPVIPNLPFFYAAYRCWSHWRALKGSDHLDFIVKHRLFRPRSTREIEDLYETIAPDSPDFTFVTRTQVLENTAPKERLILTADSHARVARVLGVPELSGEVERAVWQVNQILGKWPASEAQEKTLDADSSSAMDSPKREKR